MLAAPKPKKQTQPAVRRLDLEATLCGAIKDKKAVRLRYKNQSHQRTFEPHIIFKSSTNKFLVGGSQTKDDSKPSQPTEWRELEVGLIDSVIVTNKTFKRDPRFSSVSPTYHGLYIACTIDHI